jgi:hypothetical protein
MKAPERGLAFSLSRGIGFSLHALDLSAHLLSFDLLHGRGVLMHELASHAARCPPRAHLLLAAYLMLACLQTTPAWLVPRTS